MKSILLTALFFGVLTPCSPLQAATPNVLLILSDDQGYSDFGFTGNAVVKTPHLDRLAGESAVFRNFVVAAACSPSRAAILTGREHLGTGVWGVPPRANLRRDEVLAPAFFQRAGYRTRHVGKPDCTRTHESQPWHRGWDDAFLIDGGYLQRDPIITHQAGSGKVEGWTADILTDRALEFIRSAADAPWFMTVAHIIPHLPWVCDERFSVPFRDQGLSPELAACYGSIAQLDEAVGRLLAGLKQAGQDRRTIVVFVSDNGMTDKDPASKPLSPAGWKLRNVHQLRGHKATIWENGIRVPLLIRWPGTIPPGDRPQFGCAEDILPTLLDLAGVAGTSPAHLPFAGRSLRPALENPAVPDDHPGAFRIAIAFDGSPRAPQGIIPDPRALRYEDHHLALRGPRFKFHALPGGATALFDLAADPGETADVSATFPDTARELARECRHRWDGIMAGGRAFGMPTILVGGPATAGRRAGASIVPGSTAQSLTGRVRVVQQTAQGFAHLGDGVQYSLDVQAPGRYQVMVRGQDLDVCGPLSLHLAGVVLTPVKSAPTAISFGVTALQAGSTVLEITTGPVPAGVKPATIKDIALTPVAAGKTTAADVSATFRVPLRAGPAQLQTWFADGRGKELGGAYYVYAQRLQTSPPVKLILDTDMSGDAADAGTLALLHALADRGECELLATVVNRADLAKASAAAVDAINTYYGRPNIPIGTDKVGPTALQRTSLYAPGLRDEFPNDIGPDDKAPAALDVYRRVLAAQPDGSVTVCSVGALSNLAELWRQEPALVRAKIRRLIVMGGQFPPAAKPETNIATHPEAARLVAAEWPTEIAWQGFEVGNSVITGAALKRTPACNPVRRAFELRLFGKRPSIEGGQPSYDQAAAFYAVRGTNPELWSEERGGRVVIDPTGFSRWVADAASPHVLVTRVCASELLARQIEALMVAPPENPTPGKPK